MMLRRCHRILFRGVANTHPLHHTHTAVPPTLACIPPYSLWPPVSSFCLFSAVFPLSLTMPTLLCLCIALHAPSSSSIFFSSLPTPPTFPSVGATTRAEHPPFFQSLPHPHNPKMSTLPHSYHPPSRPIVWHTPSSHRYALKFDYIIIIVSSRVPTSPIIECISRNTPQLPVTWTRP
ncbi:hypothetical protein BS47DRAFT_1162706 [Hydnum rufescens UP504]|uniref:Uncharacterized protein n=1 Tax=Hydnum rufescens UP504 TaxID=1448309 RepID=A0A9P6DQY3_9AGAM|nr:hypothetical protein BS47DRAFT_1162706 [Hydnum rufescens UP504]